MISRVDEILTVLKYGGQKETGNENFPSCSICAMMTTSRPRMTMSHDVMSFTEGDTPVNYVVRADLKKMWIFRIILLDVKKKLPSLVPRKVVPNLPTSMEVGEVNKPRSFGFGDHDGI